MSEWDVYAVAVELDGSFKGEVLDDRLVLFTTVDDVRIYPWGDRRDFYTLDALLRAQQAVERTLAEAE